MSVDPRRRYVSDLCCGRRVSVDVGRIVYILISAVSADAGRRRVSNLAVVGLCLQMPEGYYSGSRMCLQMPGGGILWISAVVGLCLWIPTGLDGVP